MATPFVCRVDTVERFSTTLFDVRICLRRASTLRPRATTLEDEAIPRTVLVCSMCYLEDEAILRTVLVYSMCFTCDLLED